MFITCIYTILVTCNKCGDEGAYSSRDSTEDALAYCRKDGWNDAPTARDKTWCKRCLEEHTRGLKELEDFTEFRKARQSNFPTSDDFARCDWWVD